MGRNFGLTHGINLKKNNLKNEINKIMGNELPEIVFETTGNSQIMEEAYNLNPHDGKTIFVGVPNKNISIYSLPLAFNKILRVSHGGDSVPDKEIPRYIRLLENKKLNFEKLITHEFDLSDINEAINLFKTGKAGRIIININEKE